jgi:hypothetical protein
MAKLREMPRSFFSGGEAKHCPQCDKVFRVELKRCPFCNEAVQKINTQDTRYQGCDVDQRSI